MEKGLLGMDPTFRLFCGKERGENMAHARLDITLGGAASEDGCRRGSWGNGEGWEQVGSSIYESYIAAKYEEGHERG